MNYNTREYRRIRDILRFKADWVLTRIGNNMKRYQERDPMSLNGLVVRWVFSSFAYRATDMEGYAELMRGIALSISLHLACWGSGLRTPAVFTCSLHCSDWLKGGWAATWNRPVVPNSSLVVKAGIPKQPKKLLASLVMQAWPASITTPRRWFKGAGIWVGTATRWLGSGRVPTGRPQWSPHRTYVPR